jgi:hypothetical protein
VFLLEILRVLTTGRERWDERRMGCGEMGSRVAISIFWFGLWALRNEEGMFDIETNF